MGLIPSMGLPQGIDNMAEESRINGNIDDLAGTFHGVALLDETAITEDGDAGVDAGRESCVVAVDDAAKKSASDTMALCGERSPCAIDVGDVVDLSCIVVTRTWRNFEVL